MLLLNYSSLLSRCGRYLTSTSRFIDKSNKRSIEFLSSITYLRYTAIVARRYSTFEENYENSKIQHFSHVNAENDKNDFKPPSTCSSESEFSKILPPTCIENFNDDFEKSDFLPEVEEKRPGPLDTCTDDLSHIRPDFPVTFNFAAYADKSPTIRKLAELGVDFSKIEKRPRIATYIMPLDFERDMKFHIRFLNDCGVPADQLGYFLTKNPLIFKEDLDDLHTRIRYLRAHKFTPEMITRIVSHNPYWLMFSTKRIDTRLGHFQREFRLSGKEVRQLAVKQPRLITYNMKHVNQNTFAVREEMGFNKDETKLILLGKPRIWMKSHDHLVKCFDYIHNQMKLPHSLISEQPEILTCRLYKIKQRHMFLVAQGRAQYDPQKPMYISMKALISGSDSDFSLDVAKASVETFNKFLKTL